jgi:sec-independent protein translocase protein TatB
VIGDIGMGEFLVIAVVAVLILGPDKLPRAITEGLKWLRVLRTQALNARRDLVAAADLDPSITDDLRNSVRDIADLHPRRIVSSVIDDVSRASSPSPPAVPPAVAPRRPDSRPSAAASFDSDAT